MNVSMSTFVQGTVDKCTRNLTRSIRGLSLAIVLSLRSRVFTCNLTYFSCM